MAKVYYPNRIQKRPTHAINRPSTRRILYTLSNAAVLEAGETEWIVFSDEDWQVKSIGLGFSNTNAHSYSVSFQNGRSVVKDINDSLWFHLNGTLPQSITLSPGFYTGTQLAAHLKAKLDANAVYSAASVTFTVTYTSSTGIFSITPSSGTIKYLNVNEATTHRYRDSIAGHLIGFNVTTPSFSAAITSDTPVYGLNEETPDILEDVDTTDLAVYHDDPHVLSLDQAIKITGNVSSDATLMNWTIHYENLD